MIVFNTNQLDHFNFNNKSKHKPTNFNSQFNEKVKHLNNVNEHSSDKTYSQQTVDQPLISLTTQENRSNGPQYFKLQLSLVAKFAIRQYETFSNIESQQATNSMLSVNEYA